MGVVEMKTDEERRDRADPQPAGKRAWRTPQVIESTLAETRAGDGLVNEGSGRSGSVS
jgi:hypothetical protein